MTLTDEQRAALHAAIADELGYSTGASLMEHVTFLAGMQYGAREPADLLRELLAALDQSMDVSDHRDDVAAMLRYGEAEKAARIYLKALPEPT